MDSEKRINAIHDLDLKHQQASHQTDMILKDEEVRRYKLRSKISRDDLISVEERIADKEERISVLTGQCKDVRAQARAANEIIRHREIQTQRQTREIINIKEELATLNTVASDSAKLLTEKLARERELAMLKPEVEHLRNQLSHRQDVLAEKLALERQISTLEVDLANERRTAKKAAEEVQRYQAVRDDEAAGEVEALRKHLQAVERQMEEERKEREKEANSRDNKDEEAAVRMQDLRDKVSELEQQLAGEQKAAQRLATKQDVKVQATDVELEELRRKLNEANQSLQAAHKVFAKFCKESEGALADTEERRQAWKDRVGKLNFKLQETREDLKQCRAKLQTARTKPSMTMPTRTGTTTMLPTKKAPTRKKRRANEMGDEQSSLQTPDKDDDRPKRPINKRAFEASLLGEKSTFSITPLLSKTINLENVSADGIDSTKSRGEDVTVTTTLPVFQFRGVDEHGTTIGSVALDSKSMPTIAMAPPPKKAVAKAPARIEKKRGRPAKVAAASSTSGGAFTESASAKNLKTATSSRKAPFLAEPTLEKVVEEDGEQDPYQDKENRSMESSSSAGLPKKLTLDLLEPRSNSGSTSDATMGGGSKSRKRRLLNNTSVSFDEDDEQNIPSTTAKTYIAAAANKSAQRVPLPKSASVLKGPGAGVKNAFAGGPKGSETFSPLKRDRRGVNASFL